MTREWKMEANFVDWFSTRHVVCPSQHTFFRSLFVDQKGAIGGVPLFVRHPNGKKLSRIFSQSASRVISPASLRSLEIDAPVTPCIAGTWGQESSHFSSNTTKDDHEQ